MRNFIISMVLTLSVSAFGQTQPTTTSTTTKTETKTTSADTKSKQTSPSKSTSSTSSSKKKSKSKKSHHSTSPKSGSDVVKKALYSPEEKEKTRQNFIKDVDEIGMSPEVKTQYTAIVQKHWNRLKTANNDKKMTRDQATDYVNRVIKDQNEEIKEILTPEQYDKHMLIMNRYHNSVLYRIEQQ